ncbi:hypothetical protein [Aliivibrio fischeri]|uniref:hypothetical protein n=1 Tax=Aliivibrio fischeri TaxID=668 RepID=UPI0012D911A7|nr:hypothetical protein [Aliivibrio fischeri]MUJ20380.1 hypothetical protein [Aliivibrio fischeri]
MSVQNNNSSESQSDSVRLTDPNSDMETRSDKESNKKSDHIMSVALLAIVVMFAVTVYQQFLISNLTQAVSMNIVELNSLNKLNKEGDHKIAVLPLRATIKAWSAADPSGRLAMQAIDKTINVYKDAGYLILDGDSLVGGPAWAELISITPQDLDSE